jgi:polyphosphate kinase 2 (PPK2 family)
MRTSTGSASWAIVEGEDPCYRSLTVGMIVRDEIRKRLEESRKKRRMMEDLALLAAPAAEQAPPPSVTTEAGTPAADGPGAPLRVVTVLSRLDMSLSLGKYDYKRQLQEQQARLNLAHRRAQKRNTSTIVLFEGPDAAGKGGAIRRITAALDARHYQVIPTAAPTDEERAQHYLWRFWRHLSRAGRITLFDRSWYGRVLVERVEGFASEEEWRRAYAEINEFESQLTRHGIVLMKYWIHITKDEQFRRFKEREATPHKQWKLTEEDWRNREKWDAYEAAVNDLVEHTSTNAAPWVMVEGNDKAHARIKVISTLCDRLEAMTKNGKTVK